MSSFFAGNRIWGKELDMQLTLLDWSPDGRRLLFCTTAGDCHIIDAGGNPVSKVPLYCKASTYVLCSAMTLLRMLYLHICTAAPYSHLAGHCRMMYDTQEHVLLMNALGTQVWHTPSQARPV